MFGLKRSAVDYEKENDVNAQLTGKMNSIGKKDFPEASPDQNVTIFSSWRAMRTNDEANSFEVAIKDDKDVFDDPDNLLAHDTPFEHDAIDNDLTTPKREIAQGVQRVRAGLARLPRIVDGVKPEEWTHERRLQAVHSQFQMVGSLFNF